MTATPAPRDLEVSCSEDLPEPITATDHSTRETFDATVARWTITTYDWSNDFFYSTFLTNHYTDEDRRAQIFSGDGGFSPSAPQPPQAWLDAARELLLTHHVPAHAGVGAA